MPGEITATVNGVEASDSCDYPYGNRRDGSWAGARGQVAEAEIGSYLYNGSEKRLRSRGFEGIGTSTIAQMSAAIQPRTVQPKSKLMKIAF